MNELKAGQVLNRADKVNFMDVEGDEKVYTRMKGFTDMGKSANSNEYSRRYVDERTERSDVTSYAPEIGYGFDEIKDDPVQKVIVEITDDEIVGKKVSIVTVDFSQPSGSGYVARRRSWSVIPDSDGDSTDAYTYSGSFKASGDIEKGVATSSDDWQTCTFTKDTTSNASKSSTNANK